MMKSKKEKEENMHDPTVAPDAEATEEQTPSPADDAMRMTAALQTEIDSLKNQLLRKAAEFENYKRRTDENNFSLVRMANEGLIVELLSVLDDLDRSLKAGAEQGDSGAFYNGVELIRGKLMKLLESRGLKRFSSAGQPFDVGYHDALLQLPRADLPDHTIIEEIEPGYQLHEKVIRHAKVIVSSEPQDTGESGAVSADPFAADGA